MSSSLDPQSASRYLESQVMTASQPRLHLMLLDGAVRSTRSARRILQESSEWQHAETQLYKATEIAASLLQAAADGQTEVSKKLEEEYAFLYRELMSARINRDLTKLDAAIELLEYERETWKLANDNLIATGDAAEAAALPVEPVRPTTPAPSAPILPESDTLDGGLSLEA